MMRISRLMLAVGITASATLASASDVRMEPAPIQTVFIPQGFDTNDLTEVVLHGYLPNGCYKPGTVSAEVDHGKDGEIGTVYIDALVAHNTQAFCAEILVEYSEVVRVGYLKNKAYQVQLRSHGVTLNQEIDVALSQTQGPDNHIYLPVESVEVTAKDGSQELVLRGTYTPQDKNCLMPDRYEIYRAPENVIIVLPIGKVEACAKGQPPGSFVYRVPLGDDVQVGKGTLVHVRSLNGRSVNKVYDWTLFLGR